MSINASNITENIGGFPYILNYLDIYLPYSLISLLDVIVGISGNGLIISAVLISKELRKNPTCILITNLAISDLFISLIVNTSTVTGVLLGKAFFDQHMSLCVFFGAACIISCGTSLVTMGLLAFNRYVCIFHSKNYNKYFSIRNTLIYSVCAWIAGLIVDVPNFFTVSGAHVYDTKALSCLFDRLKIPYTITLSVTCIILPCLFIGLLYMRIFCHAFKTRIKSKNTISSNGNSNYRNTMEAVRIAKSLFASFFVFAACWIPVSIIFIMDREDQLPMSAHVFTNLPAHINSAINPIFYGIFNPKIRQGYQNLLRLITCNRIYAENSQQQTSTLKQPYRIEINN